VAPAVPVIAPIFWDQLRSLLGSGADIAIFHRFVRPPYGGGNQFLLALWKELRGRGWRLENNRISPATRACLFNSFTVDVARIRRMRHPGCRMIHRVDGPVDIYRGRREGVDRRVWEINQELADATVFQSVYSREEHRALGLEFTAPTVILNAADPSIFHARGRVPFDRGRKIRLIATSWSDNPNKGAEVYRALEARLDWSRFEFTFIGRSPIRFERIQVKPPARSEAVAAELRRHDIYVTASRHESCSNALIEALSCGLPAVYHDSGGNREIAGDGALPFRDEAELPDAIDRLVAEYEERQARIAAPHLSDVARLYLDVMGLRERREAA